MHSRRQLAGWKEFAPRRVYQAMSRVSPIETDRIRGSSSTWAGITNFEPSDMSNSSEKTDSIFRYLTLCDFRGHHARATFADRFLSAVRCEYQMCPWESPMCHCSPFRHPDDVLSIPLVNRVGPVLQAQSGRSNLYFHKLQSKETHGHGSPHAGSKDEAMENTNGRIRNPIQRAITLCNIEIRGMMSIEMDDHSQTFTRKGNWMGNEDDSAVSATRGFQFLEVKYVFIAQSRQ
jgi:hypothetical protein